MRYYTIIDDTQLLIADKYETLARYYDYIQELPEDYEEGKYIIGEKEIEIEVIDPETGETHTEIITVKTLVLNPNWEEEQAIKERERLDALHLTPSDVERALYKAKGMDFEDLKVLIAEQAPQFDLKALAIEFRANNFYRGVTINGIRLIDAVGALLGYTPKDMDYLFINKELPEKKEG